MTIDRDELVAIREFQARNEGTQVSAWLGALLDERDTWEERMSWVAGHDRQGLDHLADAVRLAEENDRLLDERDALRARYPRWYFAGWSDAKAGRAYGETVPAATPTEGEK